MKIKLISTCLAFLSILILGTSSLLDPNNPPTAKTGAPGETTCQQSNCHSGGAFTGTVTITGVPDTALFGHVYPITVTNTSNATRAGFELTCLDSLNAKCGVLTSASGVSIGSGSGRQYARQSTPRTLSGGAASWTFNWTAPATSAGKVAKFYVATLCANGNGQKTGDNVLLNTKTVLLTTTSPAVEPALSSSIKVYPTQAVDRIFVDGLTDAETRVNIVDLSGRLVAEKTLDQYKSLNVNDLKPGVYLLSIALKGGLVTKKFVKI